MLGPEVWRAAFKPVQLPELACILSTQDCAEEGCWYKHLQKGGRIDCGAGIGFGKLGVSLALHSVYVIWRQDFTAPSRLE